MVPYLYFWADKVIGNTDINPGDTFSRYMTYIAFADNITLLASERITQAVYEWPLGKGIY